MSAISCPFCGGSFSARAYNDHFCDADPDEGDIDDPIPYRPTRSICGVDATDELREAAALIMDAWLGQDETELGEFVHCLVRGVE